MGEYSSRLTTEERARAFAQELANFAKSKAMPADFEVVKLAKPTKDGARFNVQPAGMHRMFKTHTLIVTVTAA
jgi:hypothetical protein